MRFISVIGLAIIVAATSGCSHRMTSPTVDGLGFVAFEPTISAASGSPGHPVVAGAVAANHGITSVWYWSGCGADAGVSCSVRDASGNAVSLHDPRFLPACAIGPAELSPGESLRGGDTFTGTLWTAAGETYPAPEGDYTFVLAFSAYATPGMNAGPSRAFQTSRTFHWTP